MSEGATTTASVAAAVVEVHSPADGRVVGTIPLDDRPSVEAKATALRAAQPEWAALSFDERAKWLYRWRDWLLDNESHLRLMIQHESGKSHTDASFEVPPAAEVINYYAAHAKSFLAPENRRPHSATMASKRLKVKYSPYPLVGLIAPWNGALGLTMLDLPPALMAGCAALTKPSEETPLAWNEAVRGWREELGAPPVLDVVNGFAETGAAVVDAVDMVQFTGSVRTGRLIAVRCAERLIPCSLELGGKDAMIVCADADLERAANAAVWGGFFQAGQACISVERVYVEAPVYDRFVALVTEKAKVLRAGSERGDEFEFDYGAMVTDAQASVVERHVQDARERGAKLVLGTGKRRDDTLFIEPTVLVDVDHTMTCMREETFGPTLPVMRVDNLDEAVALANDSVYGLSASVWTRDLHKGEQLADRLHAGAVDVNTALMHLFQLVLPSGGWGESGLGGRLGGPDGIRKYCREKAVVVERLAGRTELHWYPASAFKTNVQVRMARLLGAGDWRRKVGLKGRK